MAKELGAFISEKCCMAGSIQRIGGDGCNQSFIHFKMNSRNTDNEHPLLNRKYWRCWKMTVEYIKMIRTWK